MSKELYTELSNLGLLEYGSVIEGADVRAILGIEYPKVGTKKQFDEVALAELAGIDYVRNILINQGKYIGGERGTYRIFLPSENKKQIERYMLSADRRLRRAHKLSRSTPATSYTNADNLSARIMLKRESIRSSRDAKLSTQKKVVRHSPRPFGA